jgi:hypothetical protein
LSLVPPISLSVTAHEFRILMSDYSGWDSSDKTATATMLTNVFAPMNTRFMEEHNIPEAKNLSLVPPISLSVTAHEFRILIAASA